MRGVGERGVGERGEREGRGRGRLKDGTNLLNVLIIC